MATFTDFANAIGKRFKVKDNDGKPFHGMMGTADVILCVHPETQEVEGNMFIAHYSVCRFINEMPEHLKIARFSANEGAENRVNGLTPVQLYSQSI